VGFGLLFLRIHSFVIATEAEQSLLLVGALIFDRSGEILLFRRMHSFVIATEAERSVVTTHVPCVGMYMLLLVLSKHSPIFLRQLSLLLVGL